MNKGQNSKFLEEAQAWALADIERMESELKPLIEVATKQAEEAYELLEKSGALRAVETANEFLKVVEYAKDSIPKSFYTPSEQSYALLGSETLIEPVEPVTQTIMAIEVENGEIIIQGQIVNFTNKTALGYLLLLALVMRADANGLCLYRDIDQFFITHGKKRIPNWEKAVKRIHNAKEQLLRNKKRLNIQLPEFTPEELKLIDVVAGKGLVLRNFKIF